MKLINNFINESNSEKLFEGFFGELKNIIKVVLMQ